MPPVAFDWEKNFSASFISGDQCAFQFFSFISMPAGTVLIFQLFSFYFQPFSKVDDFFLSEESSFVAVQSFARRLLESELFIAELSY